MEVKLDGRVALITGGSKGIGLAIATRMAASGADVALLARRRGRARGGARPWRPTAQGRVAHRGLRRVQRRRGRARLWRGDGALGRVDILVNNAGTSQTGAFTTITDEVWQADLDLKLFAAIRLARLVWPQMAERRWGRIINVLNIGAKAPRGGQRADRRCRGRRAWR